MSLYDFATRIKKIRDRECSLVQREATLAKDSAKYFAAVAKLREQLQQQQQQIQLSKRQTTKLSLQYTKQERLFQKQKHRLQQAKLRIEILKNTLQERLMEQEQKRQLALQQMKIMCTLKEVTKTFINLKALPAMVQGVTLCEKENTEWLPFSIEQSRHTQDEVQNHIWANARNSGPLCEEWDYLFGDNMQAQ